MRCCLRGGWPRGGARSPEQLEGMFLANHRGFSSRPLTVGWLGKYSPCHRICSETVRTILRYVLVMCCNEEVNSADDEVICMAAPEGPFCAQLLRKPAFGRQNGAAAKVSYVVAAITCLRASRTCCAARFGRLVPPKWRESAAPLGCRTFRTVRPPNRSENS